MEKQYFATYQDFRNNYTLDIPAHFNFAYDVLDSIAEERPNAVAIRHIDNDDVCREYSYEWLRAQSCRMANGLKAQGIGKGDRVMLILFRSIEFWVSMLALNRLGAVAIPCPAQLKAHDISFRLEKARIKALVIERSVTNIIDESRFAADGTPCPEAASLKLCVRTAGGDTPCPQGWTEFADLCADMPTKFARPTGKDIAGGDDPMLIFFSSGTTGMPKMVEHKFTYPLGHHITGLYWHDLNPDDIHLTVADTGWAKALWGKFYGQMMAGAITLVYDFRGKFVPQKLLEIISNYKLTSFCAPPTVFRFLVRENIQEYDLSHLRHCGSAGELLNDSVYAKWMDATGLPIYEGYGQSESSIMIGTFPNMKPKPGSIGRPVPGWNIVLKTPEGFDCPPGVEGEICVRVAEGAPTGLFLGYLDDPEKTAAAVYDGYYHSGDKAWMDEDGYFWFLGRVDDLIKSSGYRIGPFEVESALVAHPAVVEAAVTGVPDPLRGQAVKATIVLAAGYSPSDALTKELQDHVKSITAPYKYPRIVEYVAELPKTLSGKIKRAELRAQHVANAAN